jgi:NADH:ubiquinone oxidoreductase subunit 5 (subunit L)/multisubunit Na+/H+ antiporter MnhA subunit
MQIYELAWLIPLLPLAAFLIVGFLGGKMKDKGGLVALAGVGSAMVLSLSVAFQALTVGFDGAATYFEQSMAWVSVGGYDLELGIYIDTVTALMLIVVSFVATLVVIYSVGYMHDQGERRRRYFTEICLFVGVMLGLVLANNFLQLFIFWELVGLCSYLLIGFWFERPSAASAAKKAFLVTRIGDVMFMVGLIVLLTTFKTLNFHTLFDPNVIGGVDQGMLALGLFFMFGGSIGKSAQFPLHDWLPDAMEGPTTVSALIHAATMVKAGVYLVARMFPLLVFVPDVGLFIAIIGGVTALMAATMALNSPLIKRVLAYSTISQLGYMFLSLGTGAYLFGIGLKNGDEALMAAGSVAFAAGLFHLMNHAFFKALLFLSAGAVIHFVHTEELRLMGGLRKHMKVTSTVMLIGSLSIAGIPILSGFWSKDEILSSVFNASASTTQWVFLLLWLMGVVTAFLTAFYMFRMWFMTFAGEEGEATKHATHTKGEHVGAHADEHGHAADVHEHHEAPWVMLAPLVVLAVLAIGSGLVVFIGDGFSGTIFFEVKEAFSLDKIVTDWLTYLSVFVAIAGIALAYFTFYKKRIDAGAIASKSYVRPLYNMLLKRYGFTKGYDYIGEKVVYGFSLAVDWFDRNVIDGIVNLISRGLIGGGKRIRKMQTGLVQSYSTIVIGGVVALIALLYVLGFVLKVLG